MPSVKIRGDAKFGETVAGLLSEDDRRNTEVIATLLNERQVRIGRDDVRAIISTRQHDGVVTFFINEGRLGPAAKARRALVGQAASLAQQLRAVLAKLDSSDESEAAGPLKALLQWLDARAESDAPRTGF